MVEINERERKKELKEMKTTSDTSGQMLNASRHIGVPEEDKNKGHKKILEQIVVENFPNMRKEMATQVQETQRVQNRINPG